MPHYLVHVIPDKPKPDDRGQVVRVLSANQTAAAKAARQRVRFKGLYTKQDGALLCTFVKEDPMIEELKKAMSIAEFGNDSMADQYENEAKAAYAILAEKIKSKKHEAAHWSRFDYGDAVNVIQRRADSVTFPSYVIGWYERLDGWRGYVLQHRTDRLVHVYAETSVVKDQDGV